MQASRPVRVLHVDDDPSFCEVAQTVLEQEREDFDVVFETDPTTVPEHLEEGTIDCIVSDYDMPQMDGLELLERVRKDHPAFPFILFTGKGTEEVASQAISHGVTDYLQKEGGTDQFAVLANRIENAVDKRQQERQFETLVTNLPGVVYRCLNSLRWENFLIRGEAEDLTGYCASTIETDEITWGEDIVHPDDREWVWNQIQQQLDIEDAFELTYRIVTRDGDEKWVWERGARVGRTDDGEEILEGFITDITERKAFERALDRQRTILSTVIEHLPVGVIVEDESREIIAANAALVDIFGIDAPSDALFGRDCGQAAEDVKHIFTEPERFIDSITETLAARDPVSGEEFVLEDGRILERDYIPYELPDGEANLWVYEDVTERREREKLVTGLFEQSIDGIGVKEIVTDDAGDPVDYIYREVNDQFEELTGLNADEVIDRRATEVIDGIEETPFIDIFGEVALEGTTARFEQYSEPLDRYYEVSAFSPRHGQCISIFSDITERKESERKLKREREWFSTLFENFPEPTLTYRFTNGDAIVDSINDAFQESFGYDSAAAVGASIDELVVPQEQLEEAKRLTERVEKGESLDIEVQRETVDGTRYFKFRHIPLAGDNDIDGFAVYTDIHDQKEREQELKREKERLDEFASLVSHDLRNPLTVAHSRLELVALECDSDHLDHIETALDRIEQMTDDLLTLARQGEAVGETGEVDLARVVSQCWSNVQTTDAEVEVDVEMTLRADDGRLATILENLFRNAVEHGGGQVTITVGELEDGDGFFVADDGTGIAGDERGRVFDSGYTTRDDGTGFGLAIVQEIVEAHDWNIRVTESNAGGTRFEIAGVETVGEQG